MIEFSFRMVSEETRGTPLGQPLIEWADQVEALSEGRLRISVFFAGELVSAVETSDAVAAGVAEIGLHTVEFWKAPELEVFELPFIAAPGAEASTALWSLFRDGVAQTFYADMVTPLAANLGPANQLALRGVGAAPEEFAGKTVAGAPIKFFQSLGAGVATLPAVELASALNMGTVGAVAAPVWLIAAGALIQTADTVALFPGGFGLRTPAQIMTINTAALETLPPDLRQILRDTTGDTFSATLGAASAEAHNRGVQSVRISESVSTDADVIDLPGSVVEAWRAAAASFTADQLAALGSEAAMIYNGMVERLGAPEVAGPVDSADPDPAPGPGDSDGPLLPDGGAGGDGSAGPGDEAAPPTPGAVTGAITTPSEAGDRLAGGSGDDVIDALAGDDVVKSGAGDDAIDLGAGDDIALSGSGADTVLGGDGNDTVKSGAGNDSIDGGAGADVILSGDGNDTILGGDGNDTIKPGRGDDVMDGGAGDDILVAFRGDEMLIGGAGNDTLLGNLDDDTLIGGAGDDRLQGGPGRDVFVFDTAEWGHDRIVLDFLTQSDVLDFRGSGLTRVDLTITDAPGGNVLIEAGDSSILVNSQRFGALDAAAFDGDVLLFG